jgi:glycosyltransferase involved in cell wall biosynthesis
MSAVRISIVIPTQRRPNGLRTAVTSIFRQRDVDFAALELVVVDNDQAPSARPLAMELARGAPLPLIYVHEPRSGVASARNAGLEAAKGAFIAFLDDDEEAPETWLAELTAAQAGFDADVVFGPVRARALDVPASRRRYLEGFFSRVGPRESCIIDHYYGCGDSLIRRAALPDPLAPFETVRNRTGGEDDLLFSKMKRADRRFAWAAHAFVWEDPAPERLRLAYTIPRAFAFGQGPTSACAVARPPDRLGVAGWMAVGLMQALIFGAVALFKWLTLRDDRAEALDRAARGLGKLLWGGPFRLHFYGRTG